MNVKISSDARLSPLYRIITKALCISIAFTPYTALMAHNNNINESLSAKSELLQSKDSKAGLGDVTFNYKIDNGIKVNSGNSTSSVVIADDIFTEEGNKNLNFDNLNEAKTAQDLGAKNNIHAASNLGEQKTAQYASEKETDPTKQSIGQFIYSEQAKAALNGVTDLSRDPNVNAVRDMLDPNNPDSLLHSFSDACEEGFEYKTNNVSKFVGEYKTCLEYKETSESCIIKHDYDVKVISEVTPEYPITLDSCDFTQKDSSDIGATEDVRKNCIAMKIGRDARDYYIPQDSAEHACIAWKNKAIIRVDNPKAITKVLLDYVVYDDIAAIYIHKYEDELKRNSPIWQSDTVLPIRNINTMCKASKLNSNGCADIPQVEVKVFQNGCDASGSCHNNQGAWVEKYFDAPAIDFFSGATLDKPQQNIKYNCERHGNIDGNVRDITEQFTKLNDGDLIVIEAVNTVGGRGEFYARFRVEYDPQKALVESWSPEDCIAIAKRQDLNSKYAENRLFCSKTPETFLIGTEECTFAKDGNHTICSNAFAEDAPIQYTLGYNPETLAYEQTKLDPFCEQYKVLTQNNLSNTEIGLQDSCEELLESQETQNNTCYETNVACKQSTRDAEERNSADAPGLVIGGDCFLKEYTYNCGKNVEIPETEVIKTTSCADNMMLSCEGGSYIGISNSVDMSADFAKTSAILQAAQFIADDLNCIGDTEGSNDMTCRIFQGNEQKCHIFDTGATYQNCCKDITGANVQSYISSLLKVNRLITSKDLLGGMIDKIDPTGLSSKALNGTSSYTEQAHSKVLGWGDSITGIEGGSALAENVAVIALMEIYKEAIKKAIQEILTRAAISMANAAANAAAGAGSKAAADYFKKFAEDIAKDKAKETATGEMISGVASAVSVIGLVYTIYTLIDTGLKMMFKCKTSDMTTA